MHGFTNILFSPIGDKDIPSATRRIADLATRSGARLTLFGVISEPSRFQRALHRSDYLEGLQDAEQKEMLAKLARCAPKTAEIEVKTATAAGNWAFQIIEQVLIDEHDLVVVTTDVDDENHATIKRLLRKCPCPVWIIRPTRARTQRVLAAVNADPIEAALNRSILELAATLVELYGGEFHVVHAWELYGEARMRSSGFLHTPPAQIDALLDSERASHLEALNNLLSTTGPDTQPRMVHLGKGPPAEIVCEVVDKQRINVLVMGTVARTGVSGLIMGNTAESVLDNVRCSVIAVKPPGFVSPVEVVAR